MMKGTHLFSFFGIIDVTLMKVSMTSVAPSDVVKKSEEFH
jgi:hypothetical protein